MQENRSFDHYFGTMAGVRGFDDPNALKLPDGRSVFYQLDPENLDGYLLPFHLDTHASSAQKIPSTSQAWAVQHEAWNGAYGLMAASASQGRWREGTVRHGLLQEGRYSVPVRIG
jgi:phospholipase C